MDREFSLWQNFVKSGSVEDYLTYKFSSEKQEKPTAKYNKNKKRSSNKKMETEYEV